MLISTPSLRSFTTVGYEKNGQKENNTQDSNVVPHRSTNSTRQCLTSLSRREAVLSLWYGPSWQCEAKNKVYEVSQYGSNQYIIPPTHFNPKVDIHSDNPTETLTSNQPSTTE